MKPWLARLIESFAALAILAVLVIVTGVVTLTYDNVIDNDPLVAPINVDAVSGNRILLSDGRVLVAQFDSDDLATELERFGNRVDIDLEKNGNVMVYVCRRRFKCLDYGVWLRLRWVPVDYPRYRRAELGIAQIENQP